MRSLKNKLHAKYKSSLNEGATLTFAYYIPVAQFPLHIRPAFHQLILQQLYSLISHKV